MKPEALKTILILLEIKSGLRSSSIARGRFSSLILAYSFIDICANLVRNNSGDRAGTVFKKYVTDYLKPEFEHLPFSEDEFWGRALRNRPRVHSSGRQCEGGYIEANPLLRFQ